MTEPPLPVLHIFLHCTVVHGTPTFPLAGGLRRGLGLWIALEYRFQSGEHSLLIVPA